MAHPYAEHRAKDRARADKMMGRCGYANGGGVDRKEDAAMVTRGVHEHEAALHKGQPKTKLHFAEGGAGKSHLAKRARGGGLKRADGGKMSPEELRSAYALSKDSGASDWSPEELERAYAKLKGKSDDESLAQKDGGMVRRARGGKVTKVQVIVAPQGGGADKPVPVPVPVPPRAGPAMPPPGMAAPPPGAGMPPGMPPGGPGMQPPIMRARGGKVPHMEAGAMSGPGRIEKTHEYGKGGFKPKMRGVKR